MMHSTLWVIHSKTEVDVGAEHDIWRTTGDNGIFLIDFYDASSRQKRPQVVKIVPKVGLYLEYFTIELVDR